MNDQHSSDQHRPQDGDHGERPESSTPTSPPSYPADSGPVDPTAPTAPPAPPAPPVRTAPAVPSVPSVLDSVVVHAVGAVCRRRARVAVPPGGRLRLTGLPTALEGHSLRARVLSGPAGTAVTEARLEPVAELREPTELPDLRAKLNEAREREHAVRERQRLILAAVAETAALRAVPPQRRRDEPLRRTPADAWLELAEFVDERLTGLQQRAEELTREIELAHHETELLTDQLNRSSTAGPARPVEVSATVLLTLTATPPGSDHDTPGTATPTSTADLDIELEYTVRTARWVPSYRLSYAQGADTGRLVLRASVAQLTGEDWSGVRLALSTADLDRRTDLPKLRSLRIGRSQPAPPPSGWREPPGGLADLFTGYDAVGPRPGLPRPLIAGAAPRPRLAGPVAPAVALPPPAPAAPGAAPAGGLLSAYDEPHAAPPALGFAGYGAPPPPPAPVASRARGARSGSASRRRAAAPEGLGVGDDVLSRFDSAAAGGYEEGGPGAPAGPPVPDALLLDYPALVLLGPDSASGVRGTLQRSAPRPSARPGVGHLVAGIDHLALPRHAVPPRVSAGSFDHRFDAAAPADIPSDATWHTVTIDEIPVSVRPEYVTVPAVEEKVYATLLVSNPTDRAVLAGPVEVTVDDEFLLTAALPTLAPGGVSRLGIGVAESVEVTRRTELRESTAGMLNNSTVLDHRVHVELANRLGRPVTVEVRERVPVSSDSEIRIEERADWRAPTEPSPECPPSSRLWRVELPPGGRAELDGGYQIRIPAGKAIVGGNRRN
ncbi:DUF4139 domain-containing protein [Streptomyces sp. BE303]|uniref:DUF4139 domain-containing protein n=1 Tax=Streptomyces sp. BE303 TaxID=3002528 RepID=UPI002E7A8BF6|nr:DUF4139 domain-containing protein [Streptomyces sp. BE303]